MNYLARKLQHHNLAVLLNTAFDPDQFGAMTVDQANDTEFIPMDEGEYNAIISKKDFRATDKGQVILDVTWKIDDPVQQEKTGRDNLTVRQSIFLDRTESGGLDMSKGKNVGLGQLREAVGLNVAGQSFRFDDLVGKSARVKVKNRTYEEQIFSDVKKVSQLA